jgi:hypothetical protein
MTAGLTLMLLAFAGVAFAGAGAAMAVMRLRTTEQGERDLGLVSVVVMLVTFGALCAILSAGFGAIFGFGGVVMWVAYILTAHRIGMFRVEVGPRQPWPEEHHGEAWRI